jgi:hypothetical protein
MTRWITALLLLLASPAAAATLCVNPTGSGGCFSTIQAAVDDSANGDVIDVAAGTYVEDVHINDKGRLTIRGAGVGATVIQSAGGQNTVDTFGRTDVTLSGVDVRDGMRGVFVGDFGKLVLRDCAVTGHTLAALHTALKTKVTIEDCVVSGNGSSLLFGNRATIHSRGTSLTIVRSEIRDNAGGAHSDKKIEIVDSTISGNDYDGVVANIGSITGSTISGNGTAFGGGVHFGLDGFGGGSAKIKNTTISGNLGLGLSVADGYGMQLDQVTIANNVETEPGAVAGGLYTLGTRVSLKSTIIADNAPSDCLTEYPGYQGRIRLAGVNLIETVGGCSIVGRPPIVADPALGPLQDNGGPTETQVLLSGSPAIGARAIGCNGVDQRGMPRTRPCDLGAYETS